MNKLFIALVHYPVMNKKSEIVTTSITPFDVHDIARSALTFGVDHYFVVNPSPGQKKVVDRLIQFWNTGFGKTYNPKRTQALSIVSHQKTLQDVIFSIETSCGKKPFILSTSAKKMPQYQSLDIPSAKNILLDHPLLLLFGTGWGLATEIFELSHGVLDPIYGIKSYNHLSVRAAAAIILHQFAHDSPS